MKLLFISGPYRAPTIEGIKNNIQGAARWAAEYWKKGYAVICPHMNTALFDGICPDEVWLAGDLEILRRCDVLFAMPGWEKSEGARAEVAEAIRLGLEIIYG